MSKVSYVLLAAGQSARMGTDKLLLPFRGKSLLRIIAEEIAACAAYERIAVRAPNHDLREAELSDLGFKWIVNPRAEAGISSSLVAGVRAATGDVIVIVLADMVGVTKEHLKKISEIPVGSEATATRMGKDGPGGPPAAFRISLKPKLLSLTGDEGARHILRCSRTSWVHASPAQFMDIDTPSDLVHLDRLLGGSPLDGGGADPAR